MARVVYSKNPFVAGKDMEIKEYHRPVKITEIIEDMDIREQCVCLIDGVYKEDLDVTQTLKGNEIVTIQAVVESDEELKVIADVIQISAIIVASFFSAGTAAFIIAGAGLVATGIRSQIGKRNLSDVNGVQSSESPTYSLTAAGNTARHYQGLPIVLGYHRIFPDYHSRPYEELFKEPTDSVTVQDFVNFSEDSTVFPIDVGEFGDGDWVDPVAANFPTLPPPSLVGNGFSYYPIVNPKNALSFGINCPFDGYCIDPQAAIAIDNFFVGGYNWSGGSSSNPVGNFQYADPLFLAQPGIVTRRPVIVYLKEGPDAGTYWTFGDLVAAWLEFISLTGGCPTQAQIDANFTPTAYVTQFGPLDINNITVGERLVDIEQQQAPGVFQLQHHFCFGFGDLDIEDRRFGNTNMIDLREIRVSQPIKTPTAWLMAPTHSAQNIVLDTVNSYTEEGFNFNNQIDDTIYTDVDTVKGAQLINHPDSFPFPENWIVREGPENTTRIEVSLEGRAFTLGNGYFPLTFSVDVEYRIADTGVGGWVNFPGSPFAFQSIDSTVFNEEIETNVPLNKYDVRVRIGQQTPPDARNTTLEMSIRQVKFYQQDPFDYLAHNQEFISVRASEQLNGQLDQYNADVYSKCYDYDAAAGAWVWRRTSNPASLFLYMCLGGFINRTKNGVGAFPDSPTIGWATDPTLATNGYRLFGGGIPLERIDLDCLEKWHVFCETNNLEYNAVIDKNQTVSDVLHTIANIGRGSVQWSNSKIGVTYEDPDQLPVTIFTPYNILAGTFSITYRNAELPEEVQVHYVNPDNDWTQDSVFAIRPDLLPGPVDKRITIDLFGCTNQNQAQREANLIAAKQLYQRRSIRWQTDCEGLNVVRGDVVQLSHNLACWDYAGRPVKMVSDGANITSVELDCEVCIDSGFVYVRQPNGTLTSLAASFSGKVITILDPWSAADAPGTLDEEFTENTLSLYPDCCQYDWLLMAGPQPTPGKRVRITSIDYKSDNVVEITATDEEAAYYANEFTPGFVTPETTTKVKVRAFNACAIPKEDGTTGISFQLEGTYYATIEYFIDSTGPFVANFEGQEEFGDTYDYCLDLPKGVVKMSINPILVGQAFEQESAEIEFVVE